MRPVCFFMRFTVKSLLKGHVFSNSVGKAGNVFRTLPPQNSDGSVSCERSSVNIGPDSRTSRSLGHGNRWKEQGSVTM